MSVPAPAAILESDHECTNDRRDGSDSCICVSIRGRQSVRGSAISRLAEQRHDRGAVGRHFAVLMKQAVARRRALPSSGDRCMIGADHSVE